MTEASHIRVPILAKGSRIRGYDYKNNLTIEGSNELKNNIGFAYGLFYVIDINYRVHE